MVALGVWAFPTNAAALEVSSRLTADDYTARPRCNTASTVCVWRRETHHETTMISLSAVRWKSSAFKRQASGTGWIGRRVPPERWQRQRRSIVNETGRGPSLTRRRHEYAIGLKDGVMPVVGGLSRDRPPAAPGRYQRQNGQVAPIRSPVAHRFV